MSRRRDDGGSMNRAGLHTRFWIECVVFIIAAGMCVLTLVWPDWIEGIFGVDPDAHSGGLEVAVTVATVVIAALLATMARTEWRRARSLGVCSLPRVRGSACWLRGWFGALLEVSSSGPRVMVRSTLAGTVLDLSPGFDRNTDPSADRTVARLPGSITGALAIRADACRSRMGVPST